MKYHLDTIYYRNVTRNIKIIRTIFLYENVLTAKKQFVANQYIFRFERSVERNINNYIRSRSFYDTTCRR